MCYNSAHVLKGIMTVRDGRAQDGERLQTKTFGNPDGYSLTGLVPADAPGDEVVCVVDGTRLRMDVAPAAKFWVKRGQTAVFREDLRDSDGRILAHDVLCFENRARITLREIGDGVVMTVAPPVADNPKEDEEDRVALPARRSRKRELVLASVAVLALITSL